MILNEIKIFLLLYVISVAFHYYMFNRKKGSFYLPGDYYKVKGGRRIYYPLGGPVFLTIFLYVLARFLRGLFTG